MGSERAGSMSAIEAAPAPQTADHMKRQIAFHRPPIGEEEIAAVVDTLRSGWLTMGPKTRAFEEEFASAVGARHAVAVSSCTAALHLALNALDLHPEDEVITCTYTFAATANAIVHAGARPVLADCHESTLNIDVEDVARKITPRTRALIPVHFAGHPAAMDEISALARQHGLTVIEDAAHAVPASYGERMIGSISELTAFSFYATKNLTTGEGGMLTTADDELAATLRVRRLHGLSYDAWKRYTAQGSWRYEILYPGFKYNTTDINAALGLVQLRRMYELRAARAERAQRYMERLRGVPGLRLPTVLPGIEHAWHLFVVQIDPEQVSVSRDQLIEDLKADGIGTSVHFIPVHLHPYYRDTYGLTPAALPRASRVAERALSLPLYPSLEPADIDYVVDTLAAHLRRARR